MAYEIQLKLMVGEGKHYHPANLTSVHTGTYTDLYMDQERWELIYCSLLCP